MQHSTISPFLPSNNHALLNHPLVPPKLHHRLRPFLPNRTHKPRHTPGLARARPQRQQHQLAQTTRLIAQCEDLGAGKGRRGRAGS
jgi:hypothetical protein